MDSISLRYVALVLAGFIGVVTLTSWARGGGHGGGHSYAGHGGYYNRGYAPGVAGGIVAGTALGLAATAGDYPEYDEVYDYDEDGE
jgi:hypothetical protein